MTDPSDDAVAFFGNAEPDTGPETPAEMFGRDPAQTADTFISEHDKLTRAAQQFFL